MDMMTIEKVLAALGASFTWDEAYTLNFHIPEAILMTSNIEKIKEYGSFYEEDPYNCLWLEKLFNLNKVEMITPSYLNPATGFVNDDGQSIAFHEYWNKAVQIDGESIEFSMEYYDMLPIEILSECLKRNPARIKLPVTVTIGNMHYDCIAEINLKEMQDND